MRHLRGSLVLLMVMPAGAVFAAAPVSAQRARSPQLQVTIVAQVWPAYTDITANRARNNIQESLRDLGADTPYIGGQAIDPDIEAIVRPSCDPLTDWKFALGTGYRSRAVSGPWGSLSIVTNPFPRDITSLAATPLLNDIGQITGRTIPGAVTSALTTAEADLAAKPNRLWLQGGTTTDPVLNVP